MKNVIWRQYYWTISAIVLLALLAGSGFKDTTYPLEKQVAQVVESIYPIEKVGVIARSVTFPSILNQGRAIIDNKYPNASILCMDVANYSGLVNGLIWSMDRELVEEHELQYLIDQANMAFFTCVGMFIPPGLLTKIVKQQVGQGLPEEHATTQDNVEVQVADLMLQLQHHLR